MDLILCFSDCLKSQSGLINLLQLFLVEEEKMKVERNLDDLENVGFPRNVSYLFIP